MHIYPLAQQSASWGAGLGGGCKVSGEKDWMVSLASYIEGYATGLLHVECSLQWSDIFGHREELVG